MSIRLRLTLWHAALLGLVLAGFAAVVYVAVARQLADQLEYAIHLQALDASRAAHALALGHPAGRREGVALPALPAGARLAVRVVDAGGDVLAAAGSLPLLPPPATTRPWPADQDDHTTLALPGERVELYSAPLVVDDRVVGVLQVAASLRPLEARLAQLRLVLAAVVLGAVALAAALGWLLATRALRPVDRLTREARAIGRSADVARRLPLPPQRDELGRLAATFNDMLARLEQSVATQRHFLADASHELRTPLAALRTNIEIVRRGAGGDPAGRGSSLPALSRCWPGRAPSVWRYWLGRARWAARRVAPAAASSTPTASVSGSSSRPAATAAAMNMVRLDAWLADQPRAATRPSRRAVVLGQTPTAAPLP